MLVVSASLLRNEGRYSGIVGAGEPKLLKSQRNCRTRMADPSAHRHSLLRPQERPLLYRIIDVVLHLRDLGRKEESHLDHLSLSLILRFRVRRLCVQRA